MPGISFLSRNATRFAALSCLVTATLVAEEPEIVRFKGIGLPGRTPGEAFYVHYSGNPVIPGENLCAPSLVDTGAEWFFGGHFIQIAEIEVLTTP